MVSGDNHISGMPTLEDYTRRLCNAMRRSFITLTPDECNDIAHVIAAIQIDEGRRLAASLRKPNRN